jgi:hypothetical protein
MGVPVVVELDLVGRTGLGVSWPQGGAMTVVDETRRLGNKG